MALISYEQAKAQVRRTDDDDAVDITAKMEQATAIVLAYIQDEADAEWTAETDPTDDPSFALVQAAVLEVFANLYRHRGDNEKPIDGPLTERAKSILIAAGLRVPSLA